MIIMSKNEDNRVFFFDSCTATHLNRLGYTLKHPILKANLWISLPHCCTGIINPANIKIKQNRAYRKICIDGWAKHHFSDILWIIH